MKGKTKDRLAVMGGVLLATAAGGVVVYTAFSQNPHPILIGLSVVILFIVGWLTIRFDQKNRRHK